MSATIKTISLVAQKGEMLVDSRLIAKNLGLQHKHVFEQIKDFKSDFEELGVVRFQADKPQAGTVGGRPEKYALLNEDQSYLLLTYSRNTVRVRSLKIKLVKAFREARLALDVSQHEYLPTYRALHDEVHLLAAGSSNEKFVHMNFNRLVNKAVGIDAGTRNHLSLVRRSMLVVAQAVAANAAHGAADHHEGYARAKAAVMPLATVMLSEPAPKLENNDREAA
jgi:phage regulator Rha-like protein